MLGRIPISNTFAGRRSHSSLLVMNASHTTVLVTGGSGYVGTWTVAGLLERGYRVRTTIRSFDREVIVRAAVRRHTPADDRLSFVVADLLRDEGWDRAVDGVSFVLHVASPMPIREYRKTDIVRAAREGTIRILKAAAAANVSRVVMMSSAQAALPFEEDDAALTDESLWTNLTRKDATDYMRSKTLAERDAWDFIRDAGGRMDLTTVLPVTILGPVLQSTVSGSPEVLQRLLKGALPAIPRIGFSIVDVRDLVDLQVRAMLAPEASGERFIATSDFFWLREIAALLRSELGPAGAKVPSRALPDLVVRAFAFIDFEARFVAPSLGKKQLFSSMKARRILGSRFRAAHDTIVDGARSLIEMGAV